LGFVRRFMAGMLQVLGLFMLFLQLLGMSYMTFLSE
jgi:hypothetical protein